MPTISTISPSTFDSGKSVTLTGSGFGASQGQVLIGGVAQNVNTWADDEITFSTVRGSQSLGACRVDVVAGGNQYLDGPALFTLSGAEQANGTVYAGSTANSMVYDNAQAHTGSQSIRVDLSLGQPPTACGGNKQFGGRFTLPTPIPQGYSVWYRAMFYLPSTLPMGYCYSNSDDADAIACGFTSAAADGGGLIKWMVMSQDNSNARTYIYLRNERRSITLSNGFQIITEADTGALNNFSQVIPRDAWFALQMQIYVHSTAGFVRGWLNDTYLGQHTKNPLSSASYKIDEWGLGNIWNGVPYTDGNAARTSSFWIDDVIIATDLPGYGAPKTQDAGGRYYIDPTIGAGAV